MELRDNNVHALARGQTSNILKKRQPQGLFIQAQESED
jgi:hypothetical protein